MKKYLFLLPAMLLASISIHAQTTRFEDLIYYTGLTNGEVYNNLLQSNYFRQDYAVDVDGKQFEYFKNITGKPGTEKIMVGDYTRLYNGKEELFCPWSISRIARSLEHSDFVRIHRSYIVNRHSISGLRRDGEKAFCIVGDDKNLEVPVSRSRIPQLRAILHLEY